MQSERANKLIKEYVQADMPERVKKLGRRAYWDLVMGPIGCEDCGADRLGDCTCEEKYPGFESALMELKEYFGDLGTLYLETDTEYVTPNRPEGYEDEDGEWVEPEQYFEFDRRGVVRAVFGSELAQYL